MGEKIRENWINHLFQASVSAIMIFLAFWLSTSNMDAQRLQEDINSRTKNTDFIEFKKFNEYEHDKFIRTKEFDMLMEVMNKYDSRQSIIETDIKTILLIMKK